MLAYYCRKSLNFEVVKENDSSFYHTIPQKAMRNTSRLLVLLFRGKVIMQLTIFKVLKDFNAKNLFKQRL